MAYNPETRREDNTNCVSHRWGQQPGGYMRSIGTVKYYTCNNCLSLKVTWETDVKKDGEWIVITDEQIVQPNWNIALSRDAAMGDEIERHPIGRTPIT